MLIEPSFELRPKVFNWVLDLDYKVAIQASPLLHLQTIFWTSLAIWIEALSCMKIWLGSYI